MSRTPVRRLLHFLILLLAVYIALSFALYFGQRWLIYLPTQASEPAMLQLATNSGVQPWRDLNHEIIGWRRPPRSGFKAANRLMVFHGNAGCALMRTHFIDGFERVHDGRFWEVVLFEYPHFGARPGQLGEISITNAARSALAQLFDEDSRPLFLLGESLGSGPACSLAASAPRDVAGLFLITPYRSLTAMAHHRFPMFPTQWILRDQWDNENALRNFRGRVAMLLAASDEVIPVAQGQLLFAGLTCPKRLWVIPGVTHNGLPFAQIAPWWNEVSDFLADRHSDNRER
jgi:pimeloyl-ACP methyl ester carboxylesterase